MTRKKRWYLVLDVTLPPDSGRREKGTSTKGNEWSFHNEKVPTEIFLSSIPSVSCQTISFIVTVDDNLQGPTVEKFPLGKEWTTKVPKELLRIEISEEQRMADTLGALRPPTEGRRKDTFGTTEELTGMTCLLGGDQVYGRKKQDEKFRWADEGLRRERWVRKWDG